MAFKLVFVDCLEAPVNKCADLTIFTSDIFHEFVLERMRLALGLGVAHVAETTLDDIRALLFEETIVIKDVDYREVNDVQNQEE